MKRFTLLFFVLSMLSTFIAMADNEDDIAGNKGAISGRVVDTDNLPLPGASVVIETLNKGAVTDVNGFFRIPSLSPGEYMLKVAYIGFKDVSQKAAVTVGKTTELNFILKAGIDIDEVVVNGALQGQSKALNQQKNSLNVTNVISADQVGRFPDQNVGDALKRIPGINVEYDQGEARFGHIRGTAPEYNSVAVDGDRIPSAEAEIRSVQLDLIPSDMVQSIEVNKVVTSDMDADAIGGSINLVTKSNPYKRRITGSIGGSYNALREKVAPNFSVLYGDRFLNNKLGFTVAASVQDHMMGSDDLEAEWTKNDDDKIIMKEMQVRTYYIERLRQSYSAAFDYKFNANHKIDAKFMFNHRNDWENRYRVVYKDLDEDKAKIERQVKGGTKKDARLEDQRTIHVALNGKHQFGALEMKWKGSYSKANEDRPNERYLEYRIKKVEFEQNITDTEEPKVIINTSDATDLNSEWSLNELTEEHQYTEDIDKKFKVDFKYPFENGTSCLKVGAKYKNKSKSRDNDFYEYEPTDEDAFNADALSNTTNQTKSDYLAGDYKSGTFVKKEFLSGLNLSNSDKYEKEQKNDELAGNFDATENVLAAYIRFDQKLGNFDLSAGFRYEHTGVEYQGRKYEEDTDELTVTDKASKDFNNYLPSVIVKYNISNNSKLKAAWTNTIARPKYIGLVPRVEIKNDDKEYEIGNPDLVPTTSMNLDLMFETYFKSIGVFSAGVFYKDIDDFIVESTKPYTYKGDENWELKQDINAGDATLLGFEVALQRQFDFLPGVLKQMGFYANYTYTHSEVSNFQIENHNEDDLSLPGTPDHNMNASLYYEGKKLSARISYNYASDFIDEFKSKEYKDVYYDKVSYLDFNTSYKFNKNFTLFAELNNILNTPLRYYQGESKYTYQAEYYDLKVNVGLKFNF